MDLRRRFRTRTAVCCFSRIDAITYYDSLAKKHGMLIENRYNGLICSLAMLGFIAVGTIVSIVVNRSRDLCVEYAHNAYLSLRRRYTCGIR